MTILDFNKKGFTLVELIAVIAVLSLITAISAVSISSIIRENRKKTLMVSANEYKKIIEQYELDTGKYSEYECYVSKGVLTCDGTEIYSIKGDITGWISAQQPDSGEPSFCITNKSYRVIGTIDDFHIATKDDPAISCIPE